MAIDWVLVRNSWSQKPIGTIGFIGNEIAVITAFYEDKDANQDGKLSFGEKYFSLFTMKGRALAEVANQARADPDILIRDPSLTSIAGSLLVKFALGAITEGVYIAYFQAGVGAAAGAVAGKVTSNAIASFAIKKGMEKAVKDSYLAWTAQN